MNSPKEFAMTEIPEAVLLARRMYDERKTVRAIQSASRLSLDQLYRALDGLPQPDGSGGRSLEKVARILGRK